MEVLLVLPLYLILFFIRWRFQSLMKAMTDAGDIFDDIVDTPKEGIEQYKKRECLKSVIDKGKGHLLGSKWKDEKVDKASNETKKGEKTRKALGKHIINLYSIGISRWLKIKDVKRLWQEIENGPIIRDQMASLGCLFVCTFGDYLAPVLTAAHTANNLDSGDEQDHENEGYESEGP